MVFSDTFTSIVVCSDLIFVFRPNCYCFAELSPSQMFCKNLHIKQLRDYSTQLFDNTVLLFRNGHTSDAYFNAGLFHFRIHFND